MSGGPTSTTRAFLFVGSAVAHQEALNSLLLGGLFLVAAPVALVVARALEAVVLIVEVALVAGVLLGLSSELLGAK
jgi:hypothetical protein